MALELYMVGIVTRDLHKSVDFYRRLGLEIPAESEGQPHVPVKMKSGVTFFLNGSGLMGASATSRVIFEYYLSSRAEVDAKYADLTGAGYEGHRAPSFESAINVYFALVAEPDGHIIMLSAD